MSNTTVDLDRWERVRSFALAYDDASNAVVAQYGGGGSEFSAARMTAILNERWKALLPGDLVPGAPMSAQQDQLPFAPTAPDLHAKLLSIFEEHTYELSANDVTFSEFNGHNAANAILQLLGLPEVEPPERAVPAAQDGEMPW